MAAFFRWYLVVELLGLLTFPLAWRLFRRLPDRGYGVGKILGVLLVGVTLWLGAAYGVLRNDAGGAVLAVLIVSALAVVVGWPGLEPTARGTRPLVAWLRARAPQLLAVEAVFLLAFGGWALVRALDPAIRHTEQPMDLLFLSAVWTSPAFPPRDPWLAGHAISYYYLGYWLLATSARLAATPPEIAYNVGQACWFGLLATGCYSLGSNLAALGRRGDAGSDRRTAVLGGLLTVCAVALAANPHGVAAGLWAGVRWLLPSVPWPGGGLAAPGAPPWWWPSSRVLYDTDLAGRPVGIIDEFPFFSYLLGDNHPHVLAMPVDVLVVALALSLFLTRGRTNDRWLGGVPLGGAGAVVVVVAAGALVALNTWNFPAAWLLLVLACMATRYRDRRRILAVSLLVPAGAGALVLPHLLTAQSQVAGLLPNLFHPTPLWQLALVFGLFAPGLAALVLASWREGRPPARQVAGSLAVTLAAMVLGLAAGLAWAGLAVPGRAWLGSLAPPPGAASPLSFALERWLTGWPTAALLAALLAVAGALLRGEGPVRRPSSPRDRGLRFALVLLAVGLTLVLAPEVCYLRDGFGTRMNTIFKLYYQAWLLLGVAAAAGAVASLRHAGALRTLGRGAVVVLVGALAYAVVGVSWKVAGARPGSLTLNGLAYLEAEAPDELAAIRWIRANTRLDARVVQAEGDSYRAADGRISAATGRATLLGWRGHESQWRGAAFARQAAGRTGALEEIYRPTGPEAFRQTLARWEVGYVYLGPRERHRYGVGPREEEELGRVMELAFQHGDVRIFRRRE
jgi:YYY domain-containing protein